MWLQWEWKAGSWQRSASRSPSLLVDSTHKTALKCTPVLMETVIFVIMHFRIRALATPRGTEREKERVLDVIKKSRRHLNTLVAEPVAH